MSAITVKASALSVGDRITFNSAPTYVVSSVERFTQETEGPPKIWYGVTYRSEGKLVNQGKAYYYEPEDTFEVLR